MRGSSCLGVPPIGSGDHPYTLNCEEPLWPFGSPSTTRVDASRDTVADMTFSIKLGRPTRLIPPGQGRLASRSAVHSPATLMSLHESGGAHQRRVEVAD